MDIRSCSFSGHRDIPDSDVRSIYEYLTPMLTMLINGGCTDFYTGGALGFDTIAALLVLQLKSEFPHIKLHLLLPYADQAKAWKESDRETYEFIKSQANSFIYLSNEYHRGCLYERNCALVDNCDILICYMKKRTGGTVGTVRSAQGKGKRVVNVAVTEKK